MTRIVRRPIEVESWRDGHPHRFRDGASTHIVRDILDRWVEMGEWWNGEGQRTLLRVLTADEDMYDLESDQESWFIYRVWD